MVAQKLTLYCSTHIHKNNKIKLPAVKAAHSWDTTNYTCKNCGLYTVVLKSVERDQNSVLFFAPAPKNYGKSTVSLLIFCKREQSYGHKNRQQTEEEVE